MRTPCILIMFTLTITGCRINEIDSRDNMQAVAETPSDVKSVSGTYYRGDGTGYNIYLSLMANGSYEAELYGCLGKYGEARGAWSLNDSRIVFTPTDESDIMKGYLRIFDVIRFEGDWIILPTNKEEREYYNKWGVSTYSCFRKVEQLE